MAGMAGVWERDGRTADRRALERMAAALGHHALDGASAWTSADSSVLLAHLHAWDTPEEVGERQPIRSDGIVLLWDGRLDERDALGLQLGLTREQCGDLSDAQLVHRAYQQFGQRVPEHLVGPFAFVAVELDHGRMLLARDVIGRRTICWSEVGARFLFATEPWAVLADDGVDPRLDDDWIACHLALAPAFDGRTIFRGVRELRPGEALCVTSGGIHSWRFTGIGDLEPLRDVDDDEAAERVRSALDTAVQRRMRTPGPMACLMSGGLDSTPVAALAARSLRGSGGGTLRTYSYGFERFVECDERRFIGAMVEHWDLDATMAIADEAWGIRGIDRWPVNPNAPEGNLYRDLMDLIYTQIQADGQRVILAGYWGDRLYAGADGWLADLVRDGRVGEVAAEVGRHIGALGWGPVWRSASLRRMLSSIAPWAQRLRDSLGPDETEFPWLRERARNRVRAARQVRWRQRFHQGNHASWAVFGPDAASSGPSGAYHTLRFGTVVREPYSDRDVIELFLRLPAYQLYRQGRLKHATRNAMVGLLPDAIRSRDRRTRFTSLLQFGLERRRDRLDRLIDAPDALWRRYVDPAWVRGETLKGTGDRRADVILWRCMMLQHWVERRPGTRPGDRSSSPLDWSAHRTDSVAD